MTAQYAEWGVDFLKNDCVFGNQATRSPRGDTSCRMPPDAADHRQNRLTSITTHLVHESPWNQPAPDQIP